jgi:acetylornithine deacetylase/succinyl-diaminopimelate desuccinylase-like protein
LFWILTERISGQDAGGELQQIFKDKGCNNIHIDEFGSTIACFEGKRHRKRLLFDSHVNTVPITDTSGWKYYPLGGEIINDRIYERRASDMKGALAAVIMAVECFIKDTKVSFIDQTSAR